MEGREEGKNYMTVPLFRWHADDCVELWSWEMQYAAVEETTPTSSAHLQQ